MSTLPTPSSPYACLTEFVQASVRASLRSCSASSETGRTPAIAVRARRPRVMYSGFAGIVSLTERPSSLITGLLPGAERSLTRRNPVSGRRMTRVRILVRLRALAETQLQVELRVAAPDGGGSELPGGHTRDNPRNVFGARHRLPVDRHDHVALPRERDAERLGGRVVDPEA